MHRFLPRKLSARSSRLLPTSRFLPRIRWKGGFQGMGRGGSHFRSSSVHPNQILPEPPRGKEWCKICNIRDPRLAKRAGRKYMDRCERTGVECAEARRWKPNERWRSNQRFRFLFLLLPAAGIVGLILYAAEKNSSEKNKVISCRDDQTFALRIRRAYVRKEDTEPLGEFPKFAVARIRATYSDGDKMCDSDYRLTLIKDDEDPDIRIISGNGRDADGAFTVESGVYSIRTGKLSWGERGKYYSHVEGNLIQAEKIRFRGFYVNDRGAVGQIQTISMGYRKE